MPDSPPPDSSTGTPESPQAVASRLRWCVGKKSPTGRRVLNIRPASSTLLSASEDAAAAETLLQDVEPSLFATAGPDEAAHLDLSWTFTAAEFKRLVAGFRPAAMEEKWRIGAFRKGHATRVCFLRSWTNDVFFVLELQGMCATRLIYAKHLAMPEETVRAIVDGYLLNRTCVVPAPREVGISKLALMAYGIAVAGRRCDYVEPAASRVWFVSGFDPGIVRPFSDPCAIDRQLPREHLDEGMGGRFEFAHHALLRLVVAMLRPDVRYAYENDVLPTVNAGLDHNDLDLLHRWLGELAFMDEGRLRRVAELLGSESNACDGESAERSDLEGFFGAAEQTDWLIWGRGPPRDPRLRQLLASHELLAAVQRIDPRFALGRAGWIARLNATGRELLDAVGGDDVVRGWMDLRGQPQGMTTVTHDPTGYPIQWQLAAPGTKAPTVRCYWVLPYKLLAGAYPSPSSNDPASPAAMIVEELWRAGIRTFINLVEESERNNQGELFSAYLPSVRRFVEVMGERATCMTFPVRDLGVPTREQMRSILDAVDLSLDANRPVYVHCFGGVGRTGTVVGCWLRRHHLANADNVMAVIAGLRHADVARRHRSSPETSEQIAMVRAWNG